MKKRNRYCFLLFFIILLLQPGCGSKMEAETSKPKEASKIEEKADQTKTDQEKKKEGISGYKATFIELGSVNCIPCKQMQPIMKQIEKEYPEVKVVFYDVWRPEGREYAKIYRIRVIPTQVFLDENGKEYFRHEGFFPKEELEKALAKAGIDIRGGKQG